MKRWMQHRRPYFLLAVMLFLFSLLSFAGSDAIMPHIASARALARQYLPSPALAHIPRVPLSDWLTLVIIFGLLLQALGAVALVAWRSNAAVECESATLPPLPVYGAGNTDYFSDMITTHFDWEDEVIPQ